MHGSLHHFVLISVVGAGLALLVDVEPYGPCDSEYAAKQRILRRAVEYLGPRFADYEVGDGHTPPLSCIPPRRLDCRWWCASRRTFANWPPPCAPALMARHPMLLLQEGNTESRSGTRMTSPLGKPSTDPLCACCVTASTNETAR